MIGSAKKIWGGQESKIPILGKGGGGGRSLSRLASRVRAHLSSESKLRASPCSGGLLGLLGKSKRPTGFYQPLQELCHKSEGCSPTECVSGAHLGRRVLVRGASLGTLRYFGSATLGEGQWCGVELEAETGEHDGSVEGVRYFSCPAGRGLLVKESQVSLVMEDTSQGSTPGSPLNSRHSSSAGSLIPRVLELSKHSSFELDESLGILTPDQMSDFTLNNLEPSPSNEELSSFMLQDVEFSDLLDFAPDKRNSMEVVKEDKVADVSEMSESKKTEGMSTSTSARSKKESRVDRTPSLEDLPLDSAGDTSTDKSYESKTKAPNSFITSITSITSLDNGYQGDGEWSRPASRGPEHSPSSKGRSAKSRLDPMTDSDFFTESDADMADEWGHRKAQVIDGTLYNGQPCGAAGQVHRFSPNTEEMDSSGIYSDLERRPEEQAWIKEEEEVASPEGSIRTVSSKSDQSLKKIVSSPSSFSTLIEQQVNNIKNLMAMDVQEPEPEPTKEKEKPDKTKPTKRTVVSKIKIALTSGQSEDQENRVPSRPVKKGRWDAVMNKIAQGQAEERTNPRLKEVKSKVFSGISGAQQPCSKGPATPPRPATAGSRKTSSARSLSSAQSISTRSLRDIPPVKPKSRRSRLRSSESLQGTPASQASSRNSSFSDLSHPKTTTTQRSGKKREATRCASPQSDGSTHSTASQVNKKSAVHLSVHPRHSQTPVNGKNVVSGGNEKSPLVRKTTPRRILGLSQHKPQPLRDQNRVTTVVGAPGAGKNGVSRGCHQLSAAPAVQPPVVKVQTPPVPQVDPALLQHAAKGAEALAVIIQHLVFKYDAFSTPQLKKDLENIKSKWLRSQLELEELKVSYNRLQEEYYTEKTEREKELEEVEQNHKVEVDEMRDKFSEEMDKLTKSFETSMTELHRKFEEKERGLSAELERRLSAEVERRVEERKAEEERRLEEEVERRLGEARASWLQREAELVKEASDLRGRYENLKEGICLAQQARQTSSAPHSPDSNGKSKRTASCSSLQAEVESLQCVLEMRCSELCDLRRQSEVWKRDAEQLPSALQRVAALTARVASLQADIIRKEEIEKQLQEEKKFLSDTLSKESTQKKRLSLHNEELQWKLKQNSLVFNALKGLSNPGTPNKTKTPGRGPRCQSTSSSGAGVPYELNKTPSEADINPSRLRLSEKSPPSTPLVKAVIEKADSVSWTVDLEETPECVASRILRRSLRSRRSPSGERPVSMGSSRRLSVTPTKYYSGHGQKMTSLSQKYSPPTPRELVKTNCQQVSWEEGEGEGENIREEVIMVKGIGGDEVLELLSVDESDIFIDDLPRARPDEEENAAMLRRVGEREVASSLPKDSAGEAMISGEGSDEEQGEGQEAASDSEGEEVTSSSGELSDEHGTRLFRLNGTSDSGSLNMSWSEDVDILPSEG